MNTDIKQHLSDLIKEPLLEKLELQLRQPNFFYLLKLQDAEIRHSNFLAWLLNPKKDHGLGDLVLRRFLKEIFSSNAYDWIDEFSVDQLDLTTVEIRREWKHIDLLIITEGFVICIENKIQSSEHSNQLERYRSTIESSFPRLKHAFVFLTPYGTVPDKLEDSEIYQTYSYDNVASILDSLLQIYGTSLSARNRIYIEDYLTVIRREIMKDDSINELARKIYTTHSEALDFIIDNKPDRLAEVGTIFKRMVIDSGWIPGSPNKGRARFLTPLLDKTIPRSGGFGWRNKEAFLFEFDFWPKKITFRTAISPGNTRHREILSKALSSLEGAKTPKGKQWLVHFNVKWSFDVTSDKHDDQAIEKKLRDIWPSVQATVEKVESAILEKADLLQSD